MTKAKLGKEVVIRMGNEIGVLAQIAKLIAEKGINILAISAWTEGSTGIIHVVTDDNLRASDALRAQRFNPREQEVVLLQAPHKPGLLRKITERLAGEGLELHHLYAAALDEAGSVLVVFACSNNERALMHFPV